MERQREIGRIRLRGGSSASRAALAAAVARHDIAAADPDPVEIGDDTRLGDILLALRLRRRLRAARRQGLTGREAALLARLEAVRGRVVSRDVLLRDVFGYRDGVTTRTLATHVYRLRRKIGASAIETMGGGYRIRA